MNILMVHQGAELYGSDRTFIQSVRAMFYEGHSVTVILPEHGPLVAEIESFCDVLMFKEIFVLRKKFAKSFLYWARLPQLVLQAILESRKYDVVYVNTIVVWSYILASRFSSARFYVHVHEIPRGRSSFLFKTILRVARAFLIFNSVATFRHFKLTGRGCTTIENGVESVSNICPRSRGVVNFLLPGRFNSLKGQDLLLRAVAGLDLDVRSRIRLTFVGGVFSDQTWHKTNVIDLCRGLGLDDCVDFFDFQDDISSFYERAHIVAVPSLMEEPFGLVAIEAMNHGCAVIAADHGGLSDIVVHMETGIKFPPGDILALRAAVLFYLNNFEAIDCHGSNGRARFLARYTEDAYIKNISSFVR